MYRIKIADSGYGCLKEVIKEYTRMKLERKGKDNQDVYGEILACMMLLDDLNKAEHYEE